jgi:hypothetical protein
LNWLSLPIQRVCWVMRQHPYPQALMIAVIELLRMLRP